MKVILAHKFFKLTGGAEKFFFETGRVLEENGHQVAYFSTSSDDNVDSDYSDYFVRPPEYKSDGVFNRLASIKKIIYSSEAKAQFSRLIEDFKPDLVHVFAIHVHLTPSILEAAKEAGVPVLKSCNDYKHISPNYKLFDSSGLCESSKGGGL